MVAPKLSDCKHFWWHYNATMEQPKRPMGRPPKPDDERLERRAMYLTPAQWAKVDAFGMKWLRKLLDRAKPPKSE